MKTPNESLTSWLRRSGMSQGALARKVRAQAKEWGQVHIAPDASSVRRWLQGECPRTPVPDIVADVFSAAMGFRVTTYDLGLGDPAAAERGLVYSPSFTATVEAVADLGRADVDRRRFLAMAPFAATAGTGPSRDWLLGTLDQHASRPDARTRLDDVDSVRNMFTVFQKMDIFQGGGSGRLALAKYLNSHVFPLLRRTHTEEVRRALCEAAAEQTYLLGWMAYDNGEHGAAQRYLIQSLRLAEESRNPALGAHVLAGMADQATLLGHPEEGRRLAQAGRAGLSKTTSPACLADLWALEARASAKLGDRQAAASCVARSESVFEAVRLEEEPQWAAFIDPAYLHGEHANTFCDLGQADNIGEHAQRSIDYARKQNRARRGALSQAALATSHLERNDLDAAYSAGLRTLALARKVKSSRTIETVQDLRQRMRPFGNHRLVADFNERARELTAA